LIFEKIALFLIKIAKYCDWNSQIINIANGVTTPQLTNSSVLKSESLFVHNIYEHLNIKVSGIKRLYLVFIMLNDYLGLRPPFVFTLPHELPPSTFPTRLDYLCKTNHIFQ